MIRTFTFHLGLVLVIVAVAATWTRTMRLLVAAIPLVLFTLLPVCWEYRPRTHAAVAGETATVMSVNLLAVNQNTQSIIEEISAADPDVLLLQEYTEHWHQALQQSIGCEYPHVCCERREDSFGVAVYSKRPFEEPADTHLPLGRFGEPQMRVVTRIANRPVAFYNVHLLPPRGLDYTIGHRTQFADLVDLLSSEALPIVLAGDFNFTENSPHARTLKAHGFSDAHSVGGWGRGATWPVNSFFRWIPGLRLDHIYINRGLTCTECRTGTGRGSDHRPVIAELGFTR
jgi:endonuclease/exonuclease/phosphatase (EEP) superfamily protein YafD